MKQRVITAICLLAVLAVVVWQINTPILLIAVAFLSAVASGEIMKCAKVENTFIRVVGIIFSACFQLFASARVLEPWVSEAVSGKSNRRRAEYCLHHCSLPCIFPCNA